MNDDSNPRIEVAAPPAGDILPLSQIAHGPPSVDSSPQSPFQDFPRETIAQQRRQQRLALIEEFGGQGADLKRVAREAMRRGMYSRRTNPCDVELCLLHTWKNRSRPRKG